MAKTEITVFVQPLKIGNSRYLRLPPEILEKIGGAENGDNFRIDLDGNGNMTIAKVK